MEEFCSSIPFFKVGNSCTLLLTRSFENSKGNEPSLEPSPELKVVGGEECILLSDVKAKDHQKRGLVVNFSLGEKAPTPFGESKCSRFEFVVKRLVWLGVVNPLVPRLLDHLLKPGHGYPNVFKLKDPMYSWPLVIGKQKRTVIGEGGRKCIKNMGVEGCVPIGVAKKGV